MTQAERNTIAKEDTWDLSDLYADDRAWQRAKGLLEERAPGILMYKGRLSESPQVLFDCLEFHSEIAKEFSRLWSYAFMKADEDTRVSSYLSFKQELSQSISDFQTHASFIDPEVTAMDEALLRKFQDECPDLGIYRVYFQDIIRRKRHTLSEAEERLLARSGPMARNAYSVFEILSYADLPYPSITLSDGRQITLDQAGFSKYRSIPERTDRHTVFESFFDALGTFKKTFSVGLSGSVQKDIFFAKARGYESCLHAALDGSNIPVAVYHSLIENVHAALPVFKRYLRLKKKILGVAELTYPDLYAEADPDGSLTFSLSQAKEMVTRSSRFLGPEYGRVLQRALTERWIDFYPNTGKSSGAYSNGGAYDVHPYILMNFNGKYSDVSTLAHELGHTMHSYLSNTHQPYPTADYSIFVAEVASTVNEKLLMADELDKDIDDKRRLNLLVQQLDNFKGTVFRQTQFAEFELKIHAEAEAGRALSDETLDRLYREIFELYYSVEEKAVTIDPRYFHEWIYVPHFYYNFYVFQYATSFTAACVLAEELRRADHSLTDKYIRLLSAGSSRYPVDLLKEVGLDMTTPAPFERMITIMDSIMDEVEGLLA
jgi:oligoendopeptidase F